MENRLDSQTLSVHRADQFQTGSISIRKNFFEKHLHIFFLPKKNNTNKKRNHKTYKTYLIPKTEKMKYKLFGNSFNYYSAEELCPLFQ